MANVNQVPMIAILKACRSEKFLKEVDMGFSLTAFAINLELPRHQHTVESMLYTKLQLHIAQVVDVSTTEARLATHHLHETGAAVVHH